ncbi:conserved Plasmodium protein, unknown function [Plasmodium gallinaceum]|uniref:Sexual stage-specific protein G37 n=1 Tax=Plasmodium gallinaceum TaxID=5849 RepID=A0A1J1GUI4_PLAGA|nr:conserved Plasmodium protein, unknown function [Plasmodium gallinaceum]CRG95961.1 conserved Plasmodium protein, unknown function [Plasmodium gallinaceum]
MKSLTFIFLLFVIFKKNLVENIIQKQDVYLDDEFKSFTYFFASSPSANFLSRIVHSDNSRFAQVKNKADILGKTIDKVYSINQVSSVIMKVYITLLLLFLLPYFAYIGIFGYTRDQVTLTLSSILAYFALLIVFYLTNGILSIGFVCSLPLVFGLTIFHLAKSDCTTKALYKNVRYIFCFILAKLIYDIGTNLSGNESNSFDYGFSGLIYMNILKGNNYIILKIVHLMVLSFIALIIIKLFSKLFSNNSPQSPMLMQSDRYIISFLCSLPIATCFTQIFYLIYKTLNPIDPSIFFMIPSSIKFTSISTTFSLITWVIVTYVLNVLRNLVETDYNHILNKLPSNISEFL